MLRTCSLLQLRSSATKPGTNGSSYRQVQGVRRAIYETSRRSELSVPQPAIAPHTPMTRISRPLSAHGTKHYFDSRSKTAGLRLYPESPPKFNTLNEVSELIIQRKIAMPDKARSRTTSSRIMRMRSLGDRANKAGSDSG